MGKASRSRKHSAKMAKKRGIKAARKAQYLALAGTSKKRKRQLKEGRTPLRGAHAMKDCGNVGCKRCNPKQNPPSANVIARLLRERRQTLEV